MMFADTLNVTQKPLAASAPMQSNLSEIFNGKHPNSVYNTHIYIRQLQNLLRSL